MVDHYAQPGFPKLPTAPLLGFERITEASLNGGPFGNGSITASAAVTRFAWAFACHFENDPVLPGMLLIDSMLQLVGYWSGLAGARGKGRAVRVNGTKFVREVLPSHELITWKIDIRKSHRPTQTVIASGIAFVDGSPCAVARDLCVRVVS